MLTPTRLCTLLIAFAGVVPAAHAQVTLLTQDRVITVSTTADGNVQSLAAANFDPFVQSLLITTTFTAPDGTQVPNTAGTGIDCVVDPNAIRARGTLTGQGGLNIFGQPEEGEADASVFVTFSVATPTPYRLYATPRPSDNPRDEFEIELANMGTHQRLFLLRETAPPQTVDMTGVLAPGTYSIQYQVEYTSAGPQSVRNFNFNFTLGTVCGTPDFDHDGDVGTDADIEAFFACLGGNCCPTCNSSDYDGDGDAGTDADIETFFRMLAGGEC